MIYMVSTIILLTFIIYYLLKDINNTLRINSIITILSGYITMLVNTITNTIMSKKITYININNLTTYIKSIGIKKGLTLILLGTFQLIIYTTIRIYKYNKKKN